MSPIDIASSASHGEFGDGNSKVWRRHMRNDLRDLKITAAKFNDNLFPECFLDWVYSMEIIIELKDIVMRSHLNLPFLSSNVIPFFSMRT